MSRFKLAFAMDAKRTNHVFDAALTARLAAICDILDPRPMERFDDTAARALLREIDILVTGWGCPPITREVVIGAPKLKLIAHSAGTVKTFISDAVYMAGILVTHAADANAVPVAEYTLAAILFANKQVFRLHELYRADRTRASSYALMDEPIGNCGRIVGIVGASRVGRRVIRLLAPFDVRILLHDPYVSADDPVTEAAELVPLDVLMARADVVSLHAPSLPVTRHMIGRRQLALMKDGAVLINTARGALVDQESLIEELVSGRIQAIIDVTEPEIPDPTSPLFTLPNVFLTPHVAGAIGTERRRLGETAVSEVERFIAGEPLRHEIAPDTLERIA
jgi:phosphoglycerate dehydrogenase-like enzyme